MPIWCTHCRSNFKHFSTQFARLSALWSVKYKVIIIAPYKTICLDTTRLAIKWQIIVDVLQVVQAPNLAHLRIANQSWQLAKLQFHAPKLCSLEVLGSEKVPEQPILLHAWQRLHWDYGGLTMRSPGSGAATRTFPSWSILATSAPTYSTSSSGVALLTNTSSTHSLD